MSEAFEKHLRNSKKGLQAFMHHTDDKKNKPLSSSHSRGKEKATYYMKNTFPVSGNASITSPDTAEYNVPCFPHDSLNSAVLVGKTPSVRAKEGYLVSLCHDFMINMIDSLSLSMSNCPGDTFQELNRLSLFYKMKCSKHWNSHFHEIGNKPTLITPSTFLNSENVSIYLPVFYSDGICNAFPSIYCGKDDTLRHTITYRLDVHDFIVVYDLNGNVIEDEEHEKYYEVLGLVDERLQIPTMYVKATRLSPEECVHSTKCEMDKSGTSREFYPKSCYTQFAPNPSKGGTTVPLEFRDLKMEYPAISLFWGAINVRRSRMFKTYDFTIDGYNSPIKNNILTSNVGQEFKLDSYITEKVLEMDSLYGLAGVNGVNLFLPGHRHINENRFENSMCLDEGGLIVELSKSAGEQLYTVFAVIEHYKRFEFTKYPSIPVERAQSSCIVTKTAMNK